MSGIAYDPEFQKWYTERRSEQEHLLRAIFTEPGDTIPDADWNEREIHTKFEMYQAWLFGKKSSENAI